MNHLKQIEALIKFLAIPIEDDIFFDPGNTPFIYVSFIQFNGDKITDFSYGTFLNIKRKKPPIARAVPSNFDHDACLAIAKELQAGYLDDCACQNDDPDANISTEGYCDAIWINNDTRVVISIVASPQDAHYCFTHVKNQIEILSAQTESR